MELKFKILLVLAVWIYSTYYVILLQEEKPINKIRLIGICIFSPFIVICKVLYRLAFLADTTIIRIKKKDNEE